VTRWLWIQI
jgi:hypothetical protein